MTPLPNGFRAPGYLRLYENGILQERISAARGILKSCSLCPRRCGVDRSAGEKGFCRTGETAFVSSHGPHFGEEEPLVGSGGSGTIFFTHCNLGCCFCQNYEISHLGGGRETPSEKLAAMMVALQEMGCRNINFVSPSHVAAQILFALPSAVRAGLRLPLVYNSGGYDSAETLKLLEGIFDIYMPDLKFIDGAAAERFCGAADYPEQAMAAIREMHRQVGDLEIDADGVARRGLLVRHLVMPEGLAGTQGAMRFLVREISPRTYVNVMAQYRPCGEARKYPPLRRRISPAEYEEAVRQARQEGISRLSGRV